jgi:hypothetical protein
MVRVVVIVVGLTTVTGPTVTSVPLTDTVAPDTKLVPVNVTGTVFPRTPEEGVIEVSVGGDNDGAFTVNPTTPLGPFDVVTETVRAPVAAVAPIVRAVVIVVELTTVTGPTVTSVPLTDTVAPATKFVPVSVTGTAVPRVPDDGLIDASVGVGGAPDPALTVKLTAPLVPFGVVTDTVRAPTAAVAPIVRVVAIVVGLTTVTGPTPISVPLTDTVAPDAKLVPVSVTGTAAPCTPDDGLMDVSVGVPATTN